MNFVKNWREQAGFTLVELIVVIAILAILGGVAVPAYSGYVEKANKQADISLISEIEHALVLAGYNGTFNDGESGAITLTIEGISGIAEGSNLDKAMIATFGAGYKETLKLKYDNWGSNGIYNNLTPESALAVKESSYMTGTRKDNLLSDVEILTNMAQNLVTALGSNPNTEDQTLSKLFGADLLNETGLMYGVGDGDWTTEEWDAWGAEEGNKTAYSNLLVLAAANEAEKTMSDSTYQLSGAGEIIQQFSSFYAYAAVDKEFSNTLDSYLAHLNGEDAGLGLAPVTDANTGAAWYNSLSKEAGSGYVDYLNSTNEALDGESQSDVDYYGFMSILAGLGNPSEEQAAKITADLNNSNLFTDGIVNEMYNDYLDGVDAMSGLYDPNDNSYDNLGIGNGSVVVMVIHKDGKTVIVNSLP